jgi:hypothetical protein
MKAQPQLVRSEGQWFRFSRYEIVSGTHIVPTKNARIAFYRPFDFYPQILQDYLDLGRVVRWLPADSEKEAWTHLTDNAKHVLEFVEKYGVPGILWACEPRTDFNYGREDRIFVTRDSGLFHVDRRAHGWQDQKEFLKWFRVDRFSIDSALRYSASFLKAYAEPIQGVISDAVGLFEHAEDWQRLRESGMNPSDHYYGKTGRPIPGWTWEDKLRGDIATEAILTIHFDGSQPRLDYTFYSLISALHIMFALNIAAPATGQIRLCSLPECGQPFEARYDRARYCNDLHANRDRQRAFIQRQKQLKNATKGKSDGRQRSAKRR